MMGGNRRTRRKTTRKKADLQSVCWPPLAAQLRLRWRQGASWWWRDSKLGSGSSQANPIGFESRALQCECCARTPIAAGGGDDMVTTSGEGCPGDNLHQKVAAGPGAGARLPPQPTVFRNQVFFEDDPSSSTSLRPHPARRGGGEWDGWLWQQC